jgi:hypothetical protein
MPAAPALRPGSSARSSWGGRFRVLELLEGAGASRCACEKTRRLCSDSSRKLGERTSESHPGWAAVVAGILSGS